MLTAVLQSGSDGAVVDRLTFDVHIIEAGTDSYRLKATVRGGRSRLSAGVLVDERTLTAAQPRLHALDLAACRRSALAAR